MTDSLEFQWIPADLPRRMAAYAEEMDREAEVAGNEALDALNQSVPAYPSPPADSKYVRTERLGRSLGSGFGGGKMGLPDVYQFQRLGAGQYEGTFGSRLPYAPWVVGTKKQAGVHAGRWWVMADLLDRAKDKVAAPFVAAGKRLVAFLGGQG